MFAVPPERRSSSQESEQQQIVPLAQNEVPVQVGHHPEYPLTDPLTSDFPEALKPVGSNVVPWFMQTLWLHPGRAKLDNYPWLQQLHYLMLAYPFLKQSIFSICLLEKWCRDATSPSEIFHGAYKCNAKSVLLFHEERDITHQNWMAISLFAASRIVYQIGFLSQLESIQLSDCLKIFLLFRTSAGLAVRLRPFYESSETKLVLEFHKLRLDNFPEADKETVAAVQRLHFIRYPDDTLDSVKKHCSIAVFALGEWIAHIRGFPRSWAHLFPWPFVVTDEFLGLLRTRHPVALLILIHWCVVIHQAPKRWFLDVWAQRTARLAMLEVGDGWDDILEWPRRMLRLDSGPRQQEVDNAGSNSTQYHGTSPSLAFRPGSIHCLARG